MIFLTYVTVKVVRIQINKCFILNWKATKIRLLEHDRKIPFFVLSTFMNSLWSVFNYYSYKQQSRHVEKNWEKKVTCGRDWRRRSMAFWLSTLSLIWTGSFPCLSACRSSSCKRETGFSSRTCRKMAFRDEQGKLPMLVSLLEDISSRPCRIQRWAGKASYKHADIW